MIIALVLPGCVLAKGPGTPVLVKLYNAAGVHPEIVDHVETETTRLFSAANFELSWEERIPQPHELRELDDPVKSAVDHAHDCPANTQYSITVQITDRFARQFKPRAVGFSLPFAPSGVRVTIFYDRVVRIAWNVGAPVSRVLAAMVSHEIGHILIGTDGHGDSIMRPEWDAGNFQALVGPLPPIEDRDARLMHRHISDWERSAAACREESQFSVAGGQ